MRKWMLISILAVLCLCAELGATANEGSRRLIGEKVDQAIPVMKSKWYPLSLEDALRVIEIAEKRGKKPLEFLDSLQEEWIVAGDSEISEVLELFKNHPQLFDRGMLKRAIDVRKAAELNVPKGYPGTKRPTLKEALQMVRLADEWGKPVLEVTQALQKMVDFAAKLENFSKLTMYFKRPISNGIMILSFSHDKPVSELWAELSHLNQLYHQVSKKHLVNDPSFAELFRLHEWLAGKGMTLEGMTRTVTLWESWIPAGMIGWNLESWIELLELQDAAGFSSEQISSQLKTCVQGFEIPDSKVRKLKPTASEAVGIFRLAAALGRKPAEIWSGAEETWKALASQYSKGGKLEFQSIPDFSAVLELTRMSVMVSPQRAVATEAKP